MAELPVCLKKILVNKALTPVARDGSIKLVEKQVPMTVEVVEPPPVVTTINMTALKHLSGLREGPWNKVCDYLLVGTADGDDYAIFVELKKTLYGDGKPKNQLRWSLPIFKYLCAICAIHSTCEINNRNTLVRYFLIGTKNHPRFDKQRVRPQPHVQKDGYKDIEVHTYLGDRIPFNLLLNGETG